MGRLIFALSLLVGCSENILTRPTIPQPVEPPGSQQDIFGVPPGDWNNCYNGLLGSYFNLQADHPDIEPEEKGELGELQTLDLWADNYQVQERYDHIGDLDIGPNWWPVDEGLPEDPAYFSVRWVGWMRIKRPADYSFVLGASTNAWLLLNDEPVVLIEDSQSVESHIYSHPLEIGNYTVDLRWAHRYGDQSGFRFHAHSGDPDDLTLCAAEYVASTE